jgi:ATP-dependent Clp protease, protease subunit
MIHDPAGLVMGTAEDMRSMAEALDKVKGSLVQGYAARSGRAPDEIAALMAAETWFDAKDAIDAGLATRIAEPVRIAASFDIACFRNAPPELVEAIDADGTAPDADRAQRDGTAVDPDPESLADDKTFAAGRADADCPPRSDSASTDGADHTIPPAATEPCVAVANAAPDASSIRAEVLTHARAVVDLCRLAGQPQLAGRFLDEDASLDDVRARLLAAKAVTEPEIAPHHPQPGRGATTRPWGEVIARTFRMKG